MCVQFYMARQSIFLSLTFLAFMTDINAGAADRFSRVILEKLLRMKYEKKLTKDSESATFITIKEVYCKLQNVTEEIPSNGLNPIFIPVSRCIGWCHHSQKCVNTTSRLKSVNVERILDYGKDVHKVEYVNHESCDCECKIKQENCLTSQTYDALNCLCKCVKTDCPTDKQWSDSECGCACKNSLTCTNEQKWNKDKCICECPIHCCHEGKKLNKKKCLCE